MKIGFVTGTDAILPPLLSEKIADAGIPMFRVPYHLQFGPEHFLDEVEMTPANFYKKMLEHEHTGQLPFTSQPTPGEFQNVYQQAKDLGLDHVIVFPLLRKYSGTFQSAVLATSYVPDLDARIIDTKTASAGIGFLVMEAYNSVQQGKSINMIADDVNKAVDRVHIGLVVDDPKYIASRVSDVASYLVGKLLKVKLSLKVEDGNIKPHQVHRTMGTAVNALIDYVGTEEYSMGYVLHANNPNLARQLEQRIFITGNEFMNKVLVGDVTPVLGRYVGPGGAGVVLYSK